jgi:Ca2+-binding RTX toxin-like protein
MVNIIYGTAGNDRFNDASTTGNLTFDLSQGGNDTVTAGSGNDTLILGASLTAADQINGGPGDDTLVLAGDYSHSQYFGAKTLTNVEAIRLESGFDYNLGLSSKTVAARASLTLDATALGNQDYAAVSAFNAGKGTTLTFLGGSGADVFSGCKGTNIYQGGLGDDSMGSALGKDIFHFTSAADSPLLAPGGSIDTSAVDNLSVGASGQIDLSAFGLNGAVNVVKAGHFTSDLSGGTGFFGSSSVVKEHHQKTIGYGVNIDTWQIYVDVNKDGNLDTCDMLIRGQTFGKNPTFLF